MSAMDFDLHEYYAQDYRNPGPQGVMSTAGAVPEVNEKGEVTMKKVKVQRYISGKRPGYAQESSDEDDEPVFYNDGKVREGGTALLSSLSLKEDLRPPSSSPPPSPGESRDSYHDTNNVPRDRRLERLQQSRRTGERGRREVIRPEIVDNDESDEGEDKMEGRDEDMSVRDRIALPDEEDDEDTGLLDRRRDDSDDDSEDLDEEEIERRRRMVLERVKEQQGGEKDLLDLEEEDKESDEDSSEYEEYSDSEDDVEPRLKPVFVRKSERVTLQERDARLLAEGEKQEAEKVRLEARKKESHFLVEQIIKEEMLTEQLKNQAADSDDNGEAINTDDANEEEEYEGWKVRELKRIKKRRDEREARDKEATELEKVRNMTEEERRSWSRLNPKQITNRTEKGKYRFLQKYYHRGAFYLDEEDTVLRQDFSKPTLEDHFDKSTLPKVMQVKNFGRSGRTKYTHLLDQDTTAADSPWAQNNPINTKFHANAGGMKLQFEKPSNKKKNR